MPESSGRLLQGGFMVVGIYLCYLALNVFNERLYAEAHSDTSSHIRGLMALAAICS